MLGSLRKFSTSIYAKILFGIVVIPFVFWGMGSSFTSGSKSVVLKIDDDKYSIQEFVNFINMYIPPNEKINNQQIDELLSMFIGNKLVQKEIKYFNIKLSDSSLAKLIRHQKEFQKQDTFSRVEYEKFLLKKNITAATFEKNLANEELKNQFLSFVSGGILPPNFIINDSYNRVNQKRKVDVINLNDVFKEKIKFSEDNIVSYYKNNKDKFSYIYKSFKLVQLNPKKLVGTNEFNDLFFEKIDSIDDLIIEGENFDYIAEKFNLTNISTFRINEFGEDIDFEKINEIPENLIKDIFNINDSEPTALLDVNSKYFIVELTKSENLTINLQSEKVKEKILINLEAGVKRKLISEIISKINQNNYNKSDFEKLAKDKNVPIKSINLANINDNKILKGEIVNEIYAFPEKKVILVNDIFFKDVFLIYIDSISNVSIDIKPKDYDKHSNLSKNKIANELLFTYDSHIKKKYKIDINYKALDTVKNYFN